MVLDLVGLAFHLFNGGDPLIHQPLRHELKISGSNVAPRDGKAMQLDSFWVAHLVAANTCCVTFLVFETFHMSGHMKLSPRS